MFSVTAASHACTPRCLLALVASLGIVGGAARAAAPIANAGQGIAEIKKAMAAERHGECVALADEVAARFPETTVAWLYRAQCHTALGAWCEAAEGFERFLASPIGIEPARVAKAKADRDAARAGCVALENKAKCEAAHRVAVDVPTPESQVACIDACASVLMTPGQGYRHSECLFAAGRCDEARTSLETWRQRPGGLDAVEADKARSLADVFVKSAGHCRGAVVEPGPADPPKGLEPGPVQPPSSGYGTLGWGLVIGGGVAGVLGVTGFVMSDVKVQEFEDADRGGGRIDLSQSEAEGLERAAQDWWLVGVIASGVGVAALTTGVVLLALEGGRETDARVNVTAIPLRGGGGLGIEGAF